MWLIDQVLCTSTSTVYEYCTFNHRRRVTMKTGVGINKEVIKIWGITGQINDCSKTGGHVPLTVFMHPSSMIVPL